MEEAKIDKAINYQAEINIDRIKNDGPLESFMAVTQETHYLSESSKKSRVLELEQRLEIDAKKLMRKIDLVVLLPFCFLYFIANLNRNHFGFLWYNGVMMSLNMTQEQFIFAETAFYIPYVVFQAFSNLTLRHIRPHFWISISVFLYGIVIFCTGFTKNFSGFAACEFFHGFLQSGCDSAIFYILGHYYERSEGQKRISFLYAFSQLAIMVSDLISYGVGLHLEGRNGWQSWRWILVIEGSITFGSAFILFFILPDFPEGVRFFSESETLFIIKKLQIYQGKSGYNLKFSFKQIWQQLTDPLIFVPLIPCSLMGAVFYSYTFMETFSFTIIGYTKLQSTLRATWTYLAGFAACILAGFLCDILRNRVLVTWFCGILGIVGFSIIRYVDRGSAVYAGCSYFATFCITIGAYSMFPLFLGWCFYNLSGHLRRSILTSLMIAFFDTGGLYGVWIIYSDGPTMDGIGKTLVIALIMSIIILFFICVYVLVIYACNQKKRTANYKAKFALLTETEQTVLGDKTPGFDYTY